VLAGGNEFVGQLFHREDDGDLMNPLMTPGCRWLDMPYYEKDMTSYPQNQKHNLCTTVKRNSAVMELVSFQVHPISVTALAPGFTLLNHVQLICFRDQCPRNFVSQTRLK
jgi:hypothetical protein